MHKILAALICLGATLLAVPAAAVPASGTFVAARACPALQSIKSGTNPDNIELVPGQSYDIVEANRTKSPTHYRLLVPGASPLERWVDVTCNQAAPATHTASAPPPDDSDEYQPQAGPALYMLAASWQPGFCETQLDKVECLDQGEDRFDASHFALHGLWPQPRNREYCNVSQATIDIDRPSTWRLLPEVRLTPETRAELDRVMPGTASYLERHEWIVHGTCYEEDMESYFSESLRLMEDLNTSSLVDFMRDNINHAVTPAQIRAAVDAAYGEGAGTRVRIQCKQEQDGSRVVLTELQFQLYGEVNLRSELGELIHRARPQSANDAQCPRVIIDRAGL